MPSSPSSPTPPPIASAGRAAPPWTVRGLLRAPAFARGVREVAPGAAGVAIWGVITGVAMVQAGLGVAQALGMTLLVYSGTTQLATLALIVAGAPLWLIAGTALLVSLRFVVYSATLASDFAWLPPWRRTLFAYLTIDAALALYQARRERMDRDERLAYLAGANALVWIAWQVPSIVGIALAGLMPGSAGELSFVATLTVMALVVPLVRSATTVACALAAAATAVLAAGLPLKLGLFAGVVAGAAVGFAVDRARR